MFVVNKNSWHYRLLKAINEIEERRMPDDFCTYWRHAIVYPILYFLSTLGAVSILIMFVTLVVYPITGLALLWLLPATISLFVLCLSTVYVVLTIFKYLFGNSNVDTSKVRNPNIFQAKYRSIKNKICPMIRYEKE